MPGTPEMVLEDEVNSEIKTSKPGQLVTEPSKKKFSRLSLSKRKKKDGKYHYMAFKKIFFCLCVCMYVSVNVYHVYMGT